jgi:hypothetical protein
MFSLLSSVPETREPIWNESERDFAKCQQKQHGTDFRPRLHREGAGVRISRRLPSGTECLAVCRSQPHLFLFQKPQKSATGFGTQFLGIQRPVIVLVGGFETLLDDSEIFLLRECSVMIGVGSGELRR